MELLISIERSKPTALWPEGFLHTPNIDGDLSVDGYEFDVEWDATAGWNVPPPGMAGETVTRYRLVEITEG